MRNVVLAASYLAGRPLPMKDLLPHHNMDGRLLQSLYLRAKREGGLRATCSREWPYLAEEFNRILSLAADLNLWRKEDWRRFKR
jgi:hypothetical protein